MAVGQAGKAQVLRLQRMRDQPAMLCAEGGNLAQVHENQEDEQSALGVRKGPSTPFLWRWQGGKFL